MFNERKLTGTGHGFVKAYSNNWLTQLGAVYKYESPKDVLRKPNHQHRKIALYSILAMAFVAFFTLFMIVHEADRKSRQFVIESSFVNETAIEPSAGGYNTILTTPLSSGVSSSANGSSEESEKDDTTSMKRTRRLRYYGGDETRVGRDRLVLLPARFLKPPLRSASQWTTGEHKEEAPSREEAERRRDTDDFDPKPFQMAQAGPVPVGFRQARGNRTTKALSGDWTPANVQDIVRQLTLAKRKQQLQMQQDQQQQHLFYYNYPLNPVIQPAEFNHPVYPNHRVKFSGIYRHPRKDGDITTLFGAASQHPREVQLQAPQVINQQLQPDRLYNFKPSNPSEVNLLATEQFRFAPVNPSGAESEGWPPRGMPFSVMLNLEPMPIVGFGHTGQQQQQQQQRFRNRLRNPYRNPAYRQPWPEQQQNFAQLTPYQPIRGRPSIPPYRPAFGHTGSDEYEGENYFRKEGRVPPRIPPFSAPFIGPGRLMVHFNIYPRQSLAPVADRKSVQESTTPSSSSLESSIELNVGEQLAKDQPTVTVPTTETVSLHSPPTPGAGGPPTAEWKPSPTVEVLKSIEIPTQINFDHVPLGRHPPEPLPSFSRWTSDERTSRLWSGGKA